MIRPCDMLRDTDSHHGLLSKVWQRSVLYHDQPTGLGRVKDPTDLRLSCCHTMTLK